MSENREDAPSRAEDYAATARALIRSQGMAALATAQRDAVGDDLGGWPYPSLVQVAVDLDGSPLLLISALADHTKNLGRDGRGGLLFDGTAGLEERLTGARVSVLGRLAPTDDPRHRDRFLARHPGAAQYAGFGDFRVWRMEVQRAHLVAGFGRIRWIGADDLILPEEMWRDIALRHDDVVGHMNGDHADAVALYATILLGKAAGEWRMTGVDPEGCDLRCGAATARLPFDEPAPDAEAARVELVRLVKRARQIGATAGQPQS